MSKFKTALLSSIVTFLIVSAAFMIIYSQTNGSSDTTITFDQLIENQTSVVSDSRERESLSQDIVSQRQNIITETIRKVSPAVVGINVKEIRQYRSPWSNDPFWRHFFGSGIYNQEVQGIGSGVIISTDGYILTNDHVAGTADEITITLQDGRILKAERIGTDYTTDICLLKVNGLNLPYVKLGDSDEIIIGEWSIAIGNPFGLFSQSEKPTVTVGVISAVGMNLSPLNNRYYLNMIQTDASINQGNSGGPLVNSLGEMIGMNTIIYTADGSSGNIGIGFAIPVNKIKKVISELKSNGKFDRNYWTGLKIQDVDEGIATYFNLPRSRGVLVKEITNNSPAERAGFKPYDVIVAINDIRVDNSQILQGMLMHYKTDETVPFTILRDGQSRNIKMKLEKPR